MTGEAFALQLPLHHHLGGNARVIGAHHPVGIEPLHAVIADQRIHQRLLEGMTHVQGARDIGRRQLDAVAACGSRRFVVPEAAAVLPERIPARFDVGRLEALGERGLDGGLRCIHGACFLQAARARSCALSG